MTSEINSPAANAELVRAGFQAFNAGDVGECLAHIAPGLTINLAELPEPQHGRETLGGPGAKTPVPGRCCRVPASRCGGRAA
jgi:ketosteroid isomerase-like protein